MLSSAQSNVSLSSTIQTELTAKLVHSASTLKFDEVINYTKQGGNINAQFVPKGQATIVTPLLHLVNNIDSFIVTVPATQQATIDMNGRKVISGTSNGVTLKEDLVAQAQSMLELGAKVDATFEDGPTPLLAAAQQYPLTQQTNTTMAALKKKDVLAKLITLFAEHGANVNPKDDNQFKKGVLFKAAQLAGKDPHNPVEKARPGLFNALEMGLAKKELKKAKIH